MRSHEPLLNVVVRRLQGLTLNDVGDQADGLVRQGGDHVAVAVELHSHVLDRKRALSLCKPEGRCLRPESGQLNLAWLLRMLMLLLLILARHVQMSGSPV
jgi:hypothetical protein